MIGLLTPDSGEVRVRGLKAGSVKSKMELGVIPEMGNIYTDLSARENIILAGRFYGYSRRKMQAPTDELLRLFELAERGNDPVRTFSKGMVQRVNIASALVHKPKVLFLDEPTSGLDVKSQRLIKEVIREMNRQGITIVLTTHNLEEANQLCDRVCIINKGKIVAVDSPEMIRKSLQEVQSVEIGFANGFDHAESLENKWVDAMEKTGDSWKLYTHDADALVKHLVRVATEERLSINTIEICKASLEDAFIALTEGERTPKREENHVPKK
jgi:ABC-2 type transport system ATP-binding protein